MYSNWKKYSFVLIITVAFFIGAWYLSGILNQEKVDRLQTTQDRVAIDVMSNETQFDLLQETSCQDIAKSATSGTYLSSELSTLADKIAYGEQNLNAPEQLLLLKKQYTLIEVKDFLLVKRISERCKITIPTILYFYNTKNACEDCVKQGDVLDAFRRTRPNVRVYSFDYTLDSPTVRALRTIYKVEGQLLPVLVINGKTYNGFMSLENLTAAIPQ